MFILIVTCFKTRDSRSSESSNWQKTFLIVITEGYLRSYAINVLRVLECTNRNFHLCREYYFSEENLVKDLFLRRKMDPEGFIPVTLLASFHRVLALTSDSDVVLRAIKLSDHLEVVNNWKVSGLRVRFPAPAARTIRLI